MREIRSRAIRRGERLLHSLYRARKERQTRDVIIQVRDELFGSTCICLKGLAICEAKGLTVKGMKNGVVEKAEHELVFEGTAVEAVQSLTYFKQRLFLFGKITHLRSENAHY